MREYNFYHLMYDQLLWTSNSPVYLSGLSKLISVRS